MNTSRATLLGVLAILFWGTMVAMSRRLTEHLGAFTTGASICTGAGIAGTAFLAVSGRISSLRALRPGAAGLKGSVAHPTDGESYKQCDRAGAAPGPISADRKDDNPHGGLPGRRSSATPPC